jgi:hypothetical protein
MTATFAFDGREGTTKAAAVDKGGWGDDNIVGNAGVFCVL